MPASQRPDGALLAAGTALISGVSVFVNGYGVRAWTEVSNATTYTTLKNAGAAMILSLALVLGVRRRSNRTPDAAVIRRHWLGLSLVAVVGGSIPFVLFFEGLARATSTDAAFIHKTLVVWVAALAVVFLGERIRLPHLAAIALLVVGQAALSGGVNEVALGGGELMILAATLLWSIETIVSKRLLASVPPLTLGVARMAGGAVLLVVFVLARGGFGLSGVGLEHMLWIAVTSLALAGYVATWYTALARSRAIDVTAVLVGGAIITALLETGIRGVVFPPTLGVALIATGVVVFIATGWRRLATAR